jgi:CBS domain-containing protein
MVILFRWWNQPVSALKLKTPITVNPNVTVQDALQLLKNEGFDQIPVTDAGFVIFCIDLVCHEFLGIAIRHHPVVNK